MTSISFFNNHPLLVLKEKAEAHLEKAKESLKILILNNATEEQIRRMQTAICTIQEGIETLEGKNILHR